MRKLITLIKIDFKSLPISGAVVILLAPLIIMLSVYLSLPEELFSGEPIKAFDIAVADNGGDMITELVIIEVSQMDIINELHVVSFEDGQRLLREGEVAAFVDLPVGIEEALMFNRPATISLYGSYLFPVEAAILRAALSAAAYGVSAVQADVFAFTYLAENAFESRSEFVAARSNLAMRLMFLSLGRNFAVSVEATALTGYVAGLLAVIIFVSSSFAAIFVSINTAAQSKERFIPLMKMTRLGFFAFVAAKSIESVLLAALSAVIVIALLSFVGLGEYYAPLYILLAALLTSLVMVPPCLLFSLSGKNIGVTALSGFGFMLGMLFLGALYPAFLLGDVINAISAFSPAALTLGISSLAFGGAFSLMLLLSVILSALLLIPAARLWRKER